MHPLQGASERPLVSPLRTSDPQTGGLGFQKLPLPPTPLKARLLSSGGSHLQGETGGQCCPSRGVCSSFRQGLEPDVPLVRVGVQPWLVSRRGGALAPHGGPQELLPDLGVKMWTQPREKPVALSGSSPSPFRDGTARWAGDAAVTCLGPTPAAPTPPGCQWRHRCGAHTRQRVSPCASRLSALGTPRRRSEGPCCVSDWRFLSVLRPQDRSTLRPRAGRAHAPVPDAVRRWTGAELPAGVRRDVHARRAPWPCCLSVCRAMGSVSWKHCSGTARTAPIRMLHSGPKDPQSSGRWFRAHEETCVFSYLTASVPLVAPGAVPPETLLSS